MTKESSTAYPPTLVFTSVDSFLRTVQARSLVEIGYATLKRVSPFAEGMAERRIMFMLLTARDHVRNEILSCSVYLYYGDYMAPDQLITSQDEWEREHEHGTHVRQEVMSRLQCLPEVRLLDATYHVHPDVHLRFATVTPDNTPTDAGS
jgi:hypothetical protein